MPSKTVDSLVKDFKALSDKVIEMHNDVLWLKRIIVAAAGLGLIEKLFGWFFKMPH